ncbi:MAG: CotH kinase family protein, partial [Planctomycetales bacterium]|nr:CotH kinase family protein [Planctomycetales bacterium]
MDALFAKLFQRKRNAISKVSRDQKLHSETLEARQLLASDLVMSEIMASNSETYRTDDREYHDWIEVYNPGDDAVSLDGWYLTDDPDDLSKWQFPAVELAGKGFRVVSASRLNMYDVEEDEMHTNFRIASEGGYLALVRPDGTVAHAFSPEYPDQRTDVSYGFVFGDDGIQMGEPFYFVEPTPGEANGTSVIRQIVDAADVDVPRGHYNEPFDVTLTTDTPNATIKYTTDGTWPTEDHGTVVNGPVTITTTTTLRVGAFAENMLPADVTTNTYIFLEDVFKQTGEGLPEQWGYFDDQGPRRPARVDANYATDPRIVEDEDYKDTIRDDMRAVPIVSVVVDPADLWDFENGLYSNPEQKGTNWERQVSAEWIDVDGSTEWTTNAGMRIHGGWARRPSQTKKYSFKLIFRGEYGDSNLRYPLFGEDGQKEFQSIVMRGGFNDSWRDSGNGNNTYMQDQWTRAAQRNMGGYAPRDRYVHLYLNGLYWGMYSPTERMNGEWASAYMGGEPEEWDVINTGGAVVEGNSREWSQLMRLVNSRTNPPTYDQIAEVVDVEDFINYFIVNAYVGNWDWPHNNWYASRHRSEGAKWRFHSWDAEAAFQNGISEDRMHDVRNEVGPGQVFLALAGHPEFQEQFGNQVYEALFNDGALTPEANEARLREIAAGADRAIVGESLRWGDGRNDSGRPITRETWTRRIESIIRTYFPRRGERFIDQLRQVRTSIVAPLYSELEAPNYNQFGGNVTPDFDINITTDLVGAAIYYTNDGTDPRNADGSISNSAIRLTTVDLIDESSPAKILIPTGAATESNWQLPDFDDAAWKDGTTTIGYETGTVDDPVSVPDGFTVTQYNLPTRPDNLPQVEQWIADNNFEAEATISVPYINFLDGRSGGDFDNDFDFPIGGNNYATNSKGTMLITEASDYTFVVTSNDAARLIIDGNVIFADEGRHSTDSTFVTVPLALGEHT